MSPRLRVGLVLLVSAVGGAGTMVVELAAVRLLAPWFGASQAVWTNVIAVVLLALSLGYVIGGRLSERGRPLRALGTVLLLAGVATAWLPALSGPISRLFLPDGLTLQEAADVVLWGSLAASLILFLPAAGVLGCVAPLAVEAVQEIRGGTAGKAGGAVLSVSTLGSLVGVFGTGHVLLPGLGLTGTYYVAAGTLVVAGIGGLSLSAGGLRTRPGALLLLLILFAGAALGPGARPPALREGLVELARGESAYQSVRVVEEDVPGFGLMRYLQVNEGFDSFQSVWVPTAQLLPLGYYYNDFVLPWFWEEEPNTTWNVLVLGLGGGTATRVLEGALPRDVELEVVGVEIDPLVVQFSREHMELAPQGALRRTTASNVDARVSLRAVPGEFDQIIVDCYANQVEIPPHLCTLEFFGEIESELRPGGWLSLNLGGFDFDDPVVSTVARTCARAFGQDVLLLRVPHSRNFSLVARRDARLPDLDQAPSSGPVAELLRPRELPVSRRLVAATEQGAILTDDDCPIELLQRRSISAGAELLLEE